MRTFLRLTAVATLVALPLAALGIAAPATAAGPLTAAGPVTAAPATAAAPAATGATATPAMSTSTGITVRLVTVLGKHIPLADVDVIVSNETTSTDVRTDATGSVTVEHLDPTQQVSIETGRPPQNGTSTYSATTVSGVALVPEHTEVYSLTLHVGATISGQLIGPTSTSGSHKTVYVVASDLVPDDAGEWSTVTDATGHYHFDGLASGVYSVVAYPRLYGDSLRWKTVAREEEKGAPASHVVIEPHYLHSDYDLAFLLSASSEPWLDQISGASIRVTNVSTGAVFTESTSEIVDDDQQASFDLSSGIYTAVMVTPARPGSPSTTLWFTTVGGGGFVSIPAEATPFTVKYHSDNEFLAFFPLAS